MKARENPKFAKVILPLWCLALNIGKLQIFQIVKRSFSSESISSHEEIWCYAWMHGKRHGEKRKAILVIFGSMWHEIWDYESIGEKEMMACLYFTYSHLLLPQLSVSFRTLRSRIQKAKCHISEWKGQNAFGFYIIGAFFKTRYFPI